jgi:hypothetical protein
MKNLGGMKYFLGIEISRSKQRIFLSQRKHILDLLAEVRLLDCKLVDTPIIQNAKLGLEPKQPPINKKRFQRLVDRDFKVSRLKFHKIQFNMTGRNM